MPNSPVTPKPKATTKIAVRTAATRKPKLPKVNQQGQVLGPKGQQTRERLIRAVEELLHTKPLRELRLADVCRAAKVSPPAFYVYFPDIESLVLEAVARNQVLPEEMVALLAESWTPEETFHKARRLVCLYLDFWDRHYHLLKMRNLAADEGDVRMNALRYSFQVPIMEQIAKKIAEGQVRTGDRTLQPVAAASILMASLERLAPTLRFAMTSVPRDGLASDDIIDAEAWVLTRMIGGTLPTRQP